MADVEKPEELKEINGEVNKSHDDTDVVPQDGPAENEIDKITNVDQTILDMQVTNALLPTPPSEVGTSRRASRISKRKYSTRVEEPLGKNIEKDMYYDDEDWHSEYEDVEDDDDEREKEETNFLGNLVVGIQQGFSTCVDGINKVTRGHLFQMIFLVAFIAYLIAAVKHRFGDEGSHRLLGCTALGVVLITYPYVSSFFRKLFVRINGGPHLSPRATFVFNKFRFFIRWVMYIALAVVMVYVVVDEGRKSATNLRSLPGLAVFLLICLLMSTAPSRIKWHTVYWAIGMQFLCALFALKWSTGKEIVLWIQARLDEFLANSKAGSKFVFGNNYEEHFFVFGAVPVFIMCNAALVVLYYLGVMQFVIRVIGSILSFVMDATPVESSSVASSIFLDGVIAMLTFRPYLGSLTRSQFFLVLTSTFSSIGGAYIALLASFGVPVSYIIPAMVVSAPATFAVCKLMYPEKRKIVKNNFDWKAVSTKEKEKYTNIMDAAQDGAISVIALCGNIIAITFVLMSAIAWLNKTLDWFGQRVGVDDLSIEFILSYILFPVSLAMGIEWDDCRRVAMLLGYRIGSANFLAFIKLTELKMNKFKYFQYMQATNYTGPISTYRDDITLDLWNTTLDYGFISERSEAIATYSLCGFSSVLTVSVTLGIAYTLAPRRRAWLGKIGITALLAGNIANCMTGCFASLFY